MAAKTGDTVRVHYTGTLDGGEVFDSSRGRDPLEFTLGAGQVIPGFEEAVAGMSMGDERRVTIPSARAYGERRDDLRVTVGRSEFPEGVEPAVGQHLEMRQGEQRMVVRVAEIGDEEVVLDANHPLAGQNLTFDLELVEIM